ncbi:ankyrin repeat and socs box protein [Anaeramoeba flamelloides]|uniref:Ankyrin repeat and socs box protein n=1 Tax=Anaeramoeba flamelloides TaxID=1746091 RepID=A0AAV7Z4I6_9EUKA|nr:ankyrin repeat and socs box protein [Anaeramoeba flamelloides]
MPLFKIYVKDQSPKLLSQSLQAKAGMIERAGQRKFSSVQGIEDYKLYLVAPSFERFLNEDEQPLKFGETITNRKMTSLSTLHLRPCKDEEIIILHITVDDKREKLNLEINKSTKVGDGLDLVCKQLGIEDRTNAKLVVCTRTKEEDLDHEKTFSSIILSFGDQYEYTKILFKNEVEIQIEGMEETFEEVVKVEYSSTLYTLTDFWLEINSIIFDLTSKYLTVIEKRVNEKDTSISASDFKYYLIKKEIYEEFKTEIIKGAGEGSKFLILVRNQLEKIINHYLNEYFKYFINTYNLIRVCQKENVTEISSLLVLLDKKFDDLIPLKQKLEVIDIQKKITNILTFSTKEINPERGICFTVKLLLNYEILKLTKLINFMENKEINYLNQINFLNNVILSTQIIETFDQFEKHSGYLVLTTNFLHYFKFNTKKNNNNNDDDDNNNNLEQIIKNKQSPTYTFPLNFIQCKRFISKTSTTKNLEYLLNIKFGQNEIYFSFKDNEEMCKWEHWIIILQSKLKNSNNLISKDIFIVNNLNNNENPKTELNIYNCGITIKEKSNTLILNMFNLQWEIEQDGHQFDELLIKLKTLMPGIIFPISLFKKIAKIVKKRKIKDIERKRKEEETKKQLEGIVTREYSLLNSQIYQKKKIQLLELNVQEFYSKYKMCLIHSFFESLVIMKLNLIFQFFGYGDLKRAINMKNEEMIKFIIQNSIEDIPNLSKYVHLAKTINLNLVKIMIDSGCNPNCLNEEGNSLLHLSIKENNEELFQMIINNNNTDHDLNDCENKTPLFLAIERGNINFVLQLLKHDDCSISNEDPNLSPLFFAFQVKNLKIIKILINSHKNFDIDAKNALGNTIYMVSLISNFKEISNELLSRFDPNPLIKNNKFQNSLYLSIKYNNYESFEILSKKINNYHFQDINSKTLLHLANRYSSNLTIFQFLLKQNINPNICDFKTGKTILHQVIESSNLPFLKVLLNDNNENIYDVDINLANKKKQYPIHFAVCQDNPEIVKLVLNNKNINLNVINDRGETALHLALKAEKPFFAKMLIESPDCDHNISDLSLSGNSPIHIAAKRGMFGILKTLILEKKVNINLLNDKLQGPLSIAAQAGFDHIVGFLLKSNAYIDNQDVNLNTPVHLAIAMNHLKTVKFLLNYGCKLDNINIFGQSPFHLINTPQMLSLILENNTTKKKIPFSFNEKIFANLGSNQSNHKYKSNLKIYYHKLNNEIISSKINLKDNVNSIKELFQQIKHTFVKNFNLNFENEKFLYMDNHSDYVLMHSKTKIREISTFANSIHIFNTNDQFLQLL